MRKKRSLGVGGGKSGQTKKASRVFTKVEVFYTGGGKPKLSSPGKELGKAREKKK